MGNRTGIIFHENWTNFSPLLYSQHGGNVIPYQLKEFFAKIKLKSTNGNHIYSNDCEKISINFIKYSDCITRVSNLDSNDIITIVENHQYYNYFDEGVWFVNISFDNFGEVLNDDSKYYFKNGNIKNELVNLDYECERW